MCPFLWIAWTINNNALKLLYFKRFFSQDFQLILECINNLYNYLQKPWKILYNLSFQPYRHCQIPTDTNSLWVSMGIRRCPADIFSKSVEFYKMKSHPHNLRKKDMSRELYCLTLLYFNTGSTCMHTIHETVTSSRVNISEH